jgi:hypothetical protein
LAVGLAPAAADAVLDALCRGEAWTPPAAVWVQLHTGDPGVDGTANPAVETTRVQATFATPADGGTVANTAALEWPAVAEDEDYTHYSAWDAEAGVFQFSGTVTAVPATAGQPFTVAVGDLVVSLGVAA